LRTYYETHWEQEKLGVSLLPEIQKKNIGVVECMLCLFIGCVTTSWSLLGPGVEVGLSLSFIDYVRLSLK